MKIVMAFTSTNLTLFILLIFKLMIYFSWKSWVSGENSNLSPSQGSMRSDKLFIQIRHNPSLPYLLCLCPTSVYWFERRL